MRFGRSTRTLAAVGRRLLGERTDADFDGVASEERSALLNSSAEDAPMDYRQEEPQPPGADPTQSLLTALGRFQRQVNRAENGALPHVWVDECMQQLIEGISIAHDNDWHDVKEALTDTARILQSYEEAAVAPSAVPFLQDSYEILCLMVGDIIVDNVRSGVMNKWRQRYDIALNDLARHGVSLIDDDAEEPAPRPANIVRFQHGGMPEAEQASPFAEPEFEDEVEEEADLPVAAPMMEVGGDTEDARDVAEELEEEVFEEELETAEPAAGPLFEEASEVIAESTEAEEDAEEETEEETPLPALDEELYQDEVEEEPAPAPVNVVRLEEPARVAPEVADEFLFEAPAQTPRVPESAAAAPAAVRDPDDDVQSMLRNAQQAMSRGDVANAKVVALQVAVKMAELEVARAKDGLRAAEGRLEDTARAIETAGEAVRRTESGAADVEEQIGQREAEFQQKREFVAGLREEISGVHASIADIDEQIRVLQARRDEEERAVMGLQDQLEQGLAAESRIQSDLDMLAQEEEAAREALDAAKQRVRDLQRERLARESDINESRAALMQQERSVEDIQRTLQQVLGGPEEAPKETGLLF